MTPRWIAVLTAAGLTLSAAAGLYWKGRAVGAAGERSKAVAARAQAAVARQEAAGERASAQRVEVVVRQRDAAAGAVTQLTHDAMTSEDAHAPLAADRASRLRAHDDELCRIAPKLAGCATAPDAARGGAAVRDPSPTGPSDAG